MIAKLQYTARIGWLVVLYICDINLICDSTVRVIALNFSCNVFHRRSFVFIFRPGSCYSSKTTCITRISWQQLFSIRHTVRLVSISCLSVHFITRMHLWRGVFTMGNLVFRREQKTNKKTNRISIKKKNIQMYYTVILVHDRRVLCLSKTNNAWTKSSARRRHRVGSCFQQHENDAGSSKRMPLPRESLNFTPHPKILHYIYLYSWGVFGIFRVWTHSTYTRCS